MRLLLFGMLSVLIFIFMFLVTGGEDKLPERLNQIENSSLEALLREGEDGKKQKKKRDLSFLHVPKAVQTAVNESGLPLRVEEYVLMWISAAVIPALLFFLVTGSLIKTIPVALLGAALPPVFLKMKKKQRLSSFGTQLGDALPLIANGLRAGFSFEQVMETVATDMPDPISSEFARVCRELKMGMSLEESLTSMTERTQNTDMRLLTSAVLIQRQVGGNLAEILDTISITIQDRIKIKNNVASLTAQGKISGLIVGAIPVFLYFTISATNPEYMSVFSETTYGHLLLLAAVVMEGVGFVIIRKMVNLM